MSRGPAAESGTGKMLRESIEKYGAMTTDKSSSSFLGEVRTFTEYKIVHMDSELLTMYQRAGTFTSIPQMDGSTVYAWKPSDLVRPTLERLSVPMRIPAPTGINKVDYPDEMGRELQLKAIASFEQDDGDEREVLMTIEAETIRCTCRIYRDKFRCPHVNMLMVTGNDAEWTERWITLVQQARTDDTVTFGVPLFDTGDSGMFYATIRLTHKRVGGQSFGQVNLITFSESYAIPMDGTWNAEGVTYHRIGMVSAFDGREAMRSMVSSWVATQEAMLDAANTGVLTCTNHFHEGRPGSEAATTPIEKAVVILTGECLKCYFKTTDPVPTPASDIPDF